MVVQRSAVQRSAVQCSAVQCQRMRHVGAHADSAWNLQYKGWGSKNVIFLNKPLSNIKKLLAF
jgi:hypothetical protein